MAVTGPDGLHGWAHRTARHLLIAGAVLTPFNYVIGIPVGTVTVHPLEIWGLCIVALTLLAEPRILLHGADVVTLLLWTMFAFVLTSTVFGTPDEYRSRGLLDCALLAVNLAIFTVTYGHLRSGTVSWERFARPMFGGSLVGSALLGAHALTITRHGVFAAGDSYILGVGTVTGTFTAAFVAAAMIGMTLGSTRAVRTWMMAGVVLHGAAVAFSLTRAAWLSLSVGFLAAFALTLTVGRGRVAPFVVIRRGVSAVLLLLLTATAAARASLIVAGLLVVRLTQIANVSTGTGLSRIVLYRALFEDALRSVVFGHGAASYRSVSQLLGFTGSIAENFLLEMFHAGGVVAVIPLLFATGILVRRLVRGIGGRGGPGVASACLAGLLALALGALTNPAAWNASFWVLVAVCAAVGPALSADRRPTATPITATP